ncbi:DUF2790 domain-containing protein [Pseudomonas sp. 148P]|uniref:DUF2790 domain-containing protein n=1 Tax=Pseudomonas ulcerans TaxID=3115852 RepID=A0ABU7HRS4_9PSED|nr:MULTISPECIES: DUF2790 domain-containing protein [unclassified Pseudomonas]MEE1922104.1 DUF2790 domain-containing protein [Pseudomonas sp. 147P]MEE1934236.1 DUF2790 domain-containing protein [Pseudomonas sp. 148P]
MNTTVSVIAVFMLFSPITVNAEFSMELGQRIERSAREATEDYAQRVKKPMPQVEDYTYGINIDISKLVYVSPGVRYYGNVRGMVTYEDSRGELHMLRYLLKGDCIISS